MFCFPLFFSSFKIILNRQNPHRAKAAALRNLGGEIFCLKCKEIQSFPAKKK